MPFFPSKQNKSFFCVLVFALIILIPCVVNADNPKIRVTVGQSITQKFAKNVKTVSIADSDIADVVVAGPKEVLVNGKAVGLTTVVVWDEKNESTIFDVVVRGPFSDQKIELQVKVAEVNRTKASELGFDFWGGAGIEDDDVEAAIYGGPISTPEMPLSVFENRAVEGLTGAFRYLTASSNEIQVMFRALVTNGVVHILAEPNVVAASGEEASFLAGGEIPVPIASSGSQGGTTITVDWKEFGIKVKFLPTIVDANIVNLHVKPEVSSLDYNNSIKISGFNIPAVRVRRAATTVELKDEETLVIGGLLMEEETEVVKHIPLLHYIPLLGRLFENTQKVKYQTELMLVVSPHIIRALPPGAKVSLPTVHEEDTTEDKK